MSATSVRRSRRGTPAPAPRPSAHAADHHRHAHDTGQAHRHHPLAPNIEAIHYLGRRALPDERHNHDQEVPT